MPQIVPRLQQVLGEGATVNSLFDAFQVPVIMSTASTSGTWPTANRAIAVPFRRASPWTLTQCWWYNGTVAAANIDCGVYIVGDDGSLTLWPGASTGATAQSAVSSVVQTVNVPDVAMPPGLFYMALACDSTATALFRSAVSASFLRVLGAVQMNAALPLPATFTPAAVTTAYLPIFGIGTRPAGL